jgi:hypothetical protein
MDDQRETWRREVEDLVIAGFHAVDHGELDHAPRYTTDDFEMVLPNMTITGEQYAAFIAQRAQADYTTRHAVSNLRVVDTSSDAITVGYLVTGHRLNAGASAPIVNVADFVDVWQQIDGAWRHRSRSITPAFPIVT